MSQSELAMRYPGFDHDRKWRQLVAPPDYRNPTPSGRYHLVVIGAGPAGLVTSIAAAGLGARVALIERHRMGGDCLNVGCLPSKALLEITSHGGVNFDTAFEWLRNVRAGVAAHDSVERYTKAGVDVFLGTARLVDARTVRVDDVELAARRIVVATGARPALPPVPGLADVKPLTNESVFDLDAQPARLAILGAGPIGCELAQAFARLGTEVHLFEAADRVLGTETREASRVVGRALAADGVVLHLGAPVEHVARRAAHCAVTAAGETVTADQLLVAAGRRANTDDLNLAAAGVATDDAGLILVDKHLRTTNTRIFAAGDVCSRLKFTHHADAQARVVVQNALFAATASTSRIVVPHCTYTSPEVAQLGATEHELAAAGAAYDRYCVPYAELDRGRAQADEDGFVEILTERGTPRILGATIVGRDAGEQIAPLCLAMANGLGIDSFAKAVFPYPTRAEAFKRVADQFNRKKLTDRTKGWLERWFRWTR
jgi:pyruvate/2-oxoglutarate dehydrogenase complex dihydrolipoamide dehydrogenase (E3) component